METLHPFRGNLLKLVREGNMVWGPFFKGPYSSSIRITTCTSLEHHTLPCMDWLRSNLQWHGPGHPLTQELAIHLVHCTARLSLFSPPQVAFGQVLRAAPVSDMGALSFGLCLLCVRLPGRTLPNPERHSGFRRASTCWPELSRV